ncbi:hypothetical protein J7L29_08125 [Candidatus Bathyarchaeota archaeon]|nr:hypothetical protein [Candidatus Bathyarchaeota archaeon]
MPDHLTHIILGRHILKTTGLDKSASIYTMMPMLDSKPSYYHRLYDHCIIRLPTLIDAAIKWFTGTQVETLKGTREYERLREESDVFVRYAERAVEVTGDESLGKFSNDYLSTFVAVFSHIYFDTFNNPVQPFLPDCVYCSCQYDFWRSIDLWKFREKFYKPEYLKEFHKELSKTLSEDYKEKINPLALVYVTVDRFQEVTLVPPDYQQELANVKEKYRNMIFKDLINRYGRDLLDRYGASIEGEKVTINSQDLRKAREYILYLEDVLAQEVKKQLQRIP